MRRRIQLVVIGLLVIGAVTAVIAVGTFLSTGTVEPGPGGPSPHQSASGPRQAHGANWLLLDYTIRGHVVTMRVGDKLVGTLNEKSFDSLGGFKSLPNPLVEGANAISVEFACPKEAEPSRPSRMSLSVAPSAVPADGGGEEFYEFETKARLARFDFDLEIRNGRPKALKVRLHEWADGEAKELDFEHVDETADCLDGSPYAGASRAWENGRLLHEGRSIGEKIISGKSWRPDGTAGAEVTNGNGFKREWSEDGVLLLEQPYRDGLVHGEEKQFFASGKPEIVTTYSKDVAEGKYVEYYESGTVKLRGQYENGDRHGEWTWYGPDGKKIRAVTHREGQPVGKDPTQ